VREAHLSKEALSASAIVRRLAPTNACVPHPNREGATSRHRQIEQLQSLSVIHKVTAPDTANPVDLAHTPTRSEEARSNMLYTKNDTVGIYETRCERRAITPYSAAPDCAGAKVQEVHCAKRFLNAGSRLTHQLSCERFQ
jgi:hypothetical protein